MYKFACILSLWNLNRVMTEVWNAHHEIHFRTTAYRYIKPDITNDRNELEHDDLIPYIQL